MSTVRHNIGTQPSAAQSLADPPALADTEPIKKDAQNIHDKRTAWDDAQGDGDSANGTFLLMTCSAKFGRKC